MLRSWADGDVLVASGYLIDRDSALRWASKSIISGNRGVSFRENYSSDNATVTGMNKYVAGYHATGTSFSLMTTQYASSGAGPGFTLTSPLGIGAVRFYGYIGSIYDECDGSTYNGSVWGSGGKPNYFAMNNSNTVISGNTGSVISLTSSGTTVNYDVSGINQRFTTKFYMQAHPAGESVYFGLVNSQGSYFDIVTATNDQSGTFDCMIVSGRVMAWKDQSQTLDTAAPSINGPWRVFWLASGGGAGGTNASIVQVDYLRTNLHFSLGSLSYMRFTSSGTTPGWDKTTSAGVVYSGATPGLRVSAFISGALAASGVCEVRGVMASFYSEDD